MLTDLDGSQPTTPAAVAEAGRAETRRVVLIGGGPASASVLVRMAELSARRPRSATTRTEIIVIDRDGEPGGGDPHGTGTATALLLNDKLDDIDSTGIGFTAWLRANRSTWLARLLDSDDTRVRRWLRSNSDAVARTDFGGLYLPRCVFGDFIRQRFARARADLTEAGVDVRVVRAEVVTVRPATDAGWRVGLAARTGVDAHAVLLAVGSLEAPPPAAVRDHPAYFTYAGTRDIASTQVRLGRLLAAAEADRRHLVVLGSSAAASEVLFIIEGVGRALASMIGTVTVVSPSGRLAEGRPSGILRPFECRHLPALLSADGALDNGTGPATGRDNGAGRDDGGRPATLTSAALVAATVSDVELGRAGGYTIIDILPSLGPAFSAVFAHLGPDEKRAFVERDFATYRELVRHTTPEYAVATANLDRAGRLTRVRGRALGIEPADSGALRVRLARGRQPLEAAAVFDCRGFTGVRETTNPVVADLIRMATAAPNATGRGLRVNERFEAAPGLFVLGPVLAGTSHPGAHIWSLENIARIHALAEQIAQHLWTHVATPTGVSP